MPNLYTSFVLRLAGEPDSLSTADVTRVLEALQKLLRSELRRRGLGSSPPSYLGVVGFDSWPTSIEPNALSELAVDCFAYIFVDRLQSLAAQARTKRNVEGLVLLNVRHFLYERQRRNDPLGFRVYQALRAAMDRGLEEGWLLERSEPGAPFNERLLEFEAHHQGELPTSAELRSEVAGWLSELVPDLVSGSGRVWTAVVGRLAGAIRRLGSADVAAFRAADLLDVLKREIRRSWATLVETELGDSGALPPPGWEQRERFTLLVREVEGAIEAVDEQATRKDLRTLWRHLVEHAASDAEVRLSVRAMSRETGIARKRLPELLARLADLSVLVGVSRDRSEVDPR